MATFYHAHVAGFTKHADSLREIIEPRAPSPQGDRQMKAQMHDFMDGKGPVPSHIHTKGGGWVADTANVYNSAYIGPDARVSGNAWVHDNALVSGDARVKRGVYAYTPISITRSDGYTFTLQSDGSIVAGCRDFTPDEAKAHWGHPKHHKHRESMAIISAFNAIQTARS